MIVRSIRPCARRISGVRYISTSRDPFRKRPGSSAPRPLPPRQPSSPQDSTSPQDGASRPPPLPPPPSLSSVLSSTPAADNPLLAPVHIPEDPSAVLQSTHPATALLTQPSLIVQRQIEMLNLFLGFEQANRYTILSASGEHIGYMAEHDGGFGRAIGRQWFRTHRAFTTNVFDRQGNEVLRFQRPFSWINSNIRVYDALDPSHNYSKYTSPTTALSLDTDPAAASRHISPLPLDAMRIIGEAHSEWAPLRRKYNLFLSHNPSLGKPTHQTAFTQFARIDEPFLSWDFSLRSDADHLIGAVNRNFAGFGREIFTDTGVYALRMDAAAAQQQPPEGESTVAKIAQSGIGRRYGEVLGGEEERAMGMTLDQRAVMLATAVTVDFDYFSRHSHGSGVGFMPFWFWGGGGEAAGGAAAGGAAEGAGAVVGAGEGVGAVVGGAGRAAGGMTGAGEGGIAGAGTMAGYEAMQRGMGRGQEESGAAVPPSQAPVDDASPQQQQVNEYGDPVEPSSFNESQSPQEFGQGQPPGGGGGGDQGQDVWGGGDKDPWSGGADAGGGGGEGGGGLLQTLWDSFFDS